MAEPPPVLEEDAETAWELFVFGVEEPPPATRGDAEDAAWFRARLEELGFTQGAFVRWMLRRGDNRSKRGVRNSVQRMCAGKARVSGEMRVLLGLMLRSKRRTMARAAKERDEREAPWNDLSGTRGGEEIRNGRDPSGPCSDRRERDARDAPPDDLSETRGGEGNLDGRDLSEAHRGRRERDAPPADPPGTRVGQKDQDGRHLSEARLEPREPDTLRGPAGDPPETRAERRGRRR